MSNINSDNFQPTRRWTIKFKEIDGVPVDYVIPHEDIVGIKLPLEQTTRIINPSLMGNPPKTDKKLGDAMRHGATTQTDYNNEWKLIAAQTHWSTAEKNRIRTALVLQVTLEMLYAEIKPEVCEGYLNKHLEKNIAATHANPLWDWRLDYPDVLAHKVYLRIGDRVQYVLPDYID